MMSLSLLNLPPTTEASDKASSMQHSMERFTTLHQCSFMPSSYAETDCAHSDSDSDDGQHRPEAKRKSATKSPQHVWARTAPISIPSSSRPQLPSRLCESVSESPNLSYHADVRLLQASRYIDEANYAELDEDDPVFYGNLAFFRSQHGVQPTQQTTVSALSLKLEAVPASPTGVDVRDGAIFAMEL